MKRWVIVFLLFLMVACAGSSRPPAPIPQPTPQPTPEPIPEPQPEPERPAPNKGPRVILLGAYGTFNSTQSNFEKQAKAIYDSRNGPGEGFSGISAIIMTGGTQVKGAERWPWLIKNGKAQLDKRNPEYYGALREFIRTNLKYHNDIEIVFDNEYLSTTDFHPYISNDKGVSYKACPKCLYDSIILTVNPPDWKWLRWDDISESQNKYKFYLNDPIGKARGPWVDEVLRIIVEELKANPESQSKIFIRPRNEETAYIECDSSGVCHDNQHKGLGDRSEVLVWFHERATTAGLRFDNKKVFFVINRDVVGTAPDDQKCKAIRKVHAGITGKYGVGFGLDALHEMHGADAAKRAYWISKCGVNPNRTIFSTDGFGDHRRAGLKTFEEENRKALAMNHPFNTMLYEEGGAPGTIGLWKVRVKPFDKYQDNFDAVFKFHVGMIPK